MNENPYVVPQLAATRAGIPDPLVVIDGWRRRMRDLLDTDPATAAQAYDLLAVWAALQRTRPKLLADVGATDVLARAGTLLADRGAAMAADALRLPNPHAWLGRAKALEQAYENAGPAELRRDLAERLMADLDHADLLLYAARRLGVEDAAVEAEVARCHQWLVEHVQLFLAASVHAQAMGMAFRPDLQAIDYALAVTAHKYLAVLHAAEIAETELALADVPLLSPAVTRQLLARFRQQRDLAVAARTAFLSTVALALRSRMRRIPMARAGAVASLEPLWWWEWRSPAGDLGGRLTIPPQPSPDQQVVVEFVGRDLRRAVHLAGQPVRLHGAASRIDDQGRAIFPLESLLDTDEPLALRVGPKQVRWRLTAAHADLPAVPHAPQADSGG